MSCAFIFPGQGSQTLKMMDNLLSFNQVRKQFAIAKEVLNIDYFQMLQEDTSDNINNTLNTQPLLLTAGYATYMSWIDCGYQPPSILAGHSLGEWTALLVAGVVSFEDALNIVKLRSTLMQNAVHNQEYLMVAILGLDDNIIIETCSQVSSLTNKVVEAVNFNCPGQVVIGGDKDCVSLAIEKLKSSHNIKFIVLPMSVPSHCALMKDASEKFALYLKTIQFKQPKIKVFFNFNSESYMDTDVIKEMMIKQLYNPVQWTKVIKSIVDSGIKNIVECFPGRVLSNFNKRIDSNIQSFYLKSADDFKNTYETIF